MICGEAIIVKLIQVNVIRIEPRKGFFTGLADTGRRRIRTCHLARLLIEHRIELGGDDNLVALSVGVQVMNALLLPIVLGFLFLLARGLPEPWRLKGWYAWLSGSLIAVTTIFGVYSGLAGLWG